MVGLVRTFYEFFSGGGLARYGLGPQWRCLLANDIDEKKAACYRANFGSEELIVADVASLETSHLAGTADLAWASFPCQDLSLAGNGAGLRGHRSGAFWPFWKIMRGLAAQSRAPKLIVLENVCGTLTSHSGEAFCAIANAFSSIAYQFGALVVDARLF